MWQARKGTSALFRADRRYALSSKVIALTADAFFTLEYAVSVPTVIHINQHFSIEPSSIIEIAKLQSLNYFFLPKVEWRRELRSEIIYLINPFISHIFLEEFLAKASLYLLLIETERIAKNVEFIFSPIFLSKFITAKIITESIFLNLIPSSAESITQKAEILHSLLFNLFTEKRLEIGTTYRLLSKVYSNFILEKRVPFDFDAESIRELARSADAYFSFLTQAILPTIPGAATYLALLKCKASSKLNTISSETVSLLYGAEGKLLLERCFECLLFNCIDLEYLRILALSIHLKNQTVASLLPILSGTLWMKLLAETYLPGLYSLVAEILFQQHSTYSMYLKESYIRKLLINAIATIGIFAPFIFTVLIKLRAGTSPSFHSIISETLKINYSFLSAFFSTINQNLMFKILFEKTAAHELIGNILVSLLPSAPFSFYSDFSATLLAHFTSSLPIFVPSLPFGKLSFMDLSRIYNYQISDLRKVRKILIEW